LPPTITLSADRATITAGETVTLSWQSTNATTVVLDNSIGNVATSGTRQLSPQTTTSYSAIARGAGGSATSAAVRIAVNNPVPPPQRSESSRTAANSRTPTLAEQFQAAMQNILFDYDRSSIRATELPKLQAAAQWLSANRSVRLAIEGNADERGSQEYNIALGDERAAVVRKYLVDHGVLESRLDALSYGEERPLCRDQNEDCWQRNRRAQFTMKP
jgi:peptidoglycan-associated lipoprotein